jgi:hypothetical protein
MDDIIILSSSGVQQGGPEGPALFCTGLKKIIKKINKACSLKYNRWFMDDGNLVGTSEEIIKAWNIIVNHGPQLGLYVNSPKCEWIPLGEPIPCPIPNVKENLIKNFEVLGAPIGDKTYTESYVDQVLSEFSKILTELPELEHSQSATLLLRGCFSYCKAVYIMRTVPPPLYLNTSEMFDSKVKQCFEKILGTSLSPNAWMQASLGFSCGGLGIRPTQRHAPGAFISSITNNEHLNHNTVEDMQSSIDEAWNTINNKYAQFKIPNILKQGNMSTAIDECKLHELSNNSNALDQRRLKSCQAPHSNSWAQAFPVRAQNTFFTDAEFRFSCLHWLGADITPVNTSCMVCTQPITPKASHTVKCLSRGDIIIRHNALRDTFFNIASTACLAPCLEKSGILGDLPGQRPADVWIPNLYNNEPTAIDFAVTCPTQQKYNNSDNAANTYATEVKHKKYDTGFIGTGINFCAAVVDTYGQWSDEGLNVISDVINRAAKRLITDPSHYKTIAWQQLSCVLQIHISRMIISRIAPPDSDIM